RGHRLARRHSVPVEAVVNSGGPRSSLFLMLNTPRARRGMVTSPHHLASEAGLRVLREGGNAIEATIAMAATLAVVYPHMTSIGGDGLGLIAPPAHEPVGIDACVPSSAAATPRCYRQRGHACKI